MCGIVGYVGGRECIDFLVQGLRRLEYRGYDSSGVVTLGPTTPLSVVKSAGRIDKLVAKLAHDPANGTTGVGHTRWATHGPATDVNAHPHLGGDGIVAVVHNGVIENFRPLKQRLESLGYVFQSQTDTEVVAHLVAEQLTQELSANPIATVQEMAAANFEPLVNAVRGALQKLTGTYGLGVVFRDFPNVLIAAKLGSPLVVGVGQGEHFLASDASPLVGSTDKIVYLNDHELAVVTADSLRVLHRDMGETQADVRTLDVRAGDVDKGDYEHFMLKEIFEQPDTLRNTMRGRLRADEATAHFGGLNLTAKELRSVRRIVLTGCGTSWHAGLVGKYLIEELARIPVEVEYASELRYRNPPLDDGTLVFAITQSGETADTLAAMREMKRMGHQTLAISNVVGSTIAQEAHGGRLSRAPGGQGELPPEAVDAHDASLALDRLPELLVEELHLGGRWPVALADADGAWEIRRDPGAVGHGE